jgi:hypothetical protein
MQDGVQQPVQNILISLLLTGNLRIKRHKTCSLQVVEVIHFIYEGHVESGQSYFMQ